MKIILIITVLILLGAGIWYLMVETKEPISNSIPPPEKNSMPEKSLDKKIAMIIAFKDFQDQEYFDTKEVLESRGAKITTCSSSLGMAIGKYGGEVDIEMKLDELNVENFDAIVFIGGPGASNYIDDVRCQQIAKETLTQNKVLGAICIAPAILAKAGVLQGKKATVWTSPLDKSTAKILKDNGANYQEQDVVVDGKIVTADGPAAAKKFGQAIAKLLE